MSFFHKSIFPTYIYRVYTHNLYSKHISITFSNNNNTNPLQIGVWKHKTCKNQFQNTPNTHTSENCMNKSKKNQIWVFDTTYLTSSTIRKKKCHLFRRKQSSRLNVVMNLLFFGLFDLEEEDEAIKGKSEISRGKH